MIYSVHNSEASAKGLNAENGLFNALVVVGISRSEDVLDTLSIDDRYNLMKERYQSRYQSENFALCNRGIRCICSILREKKIPIRRKKCMSYVFTKSGKSIYTDVTITSFAKALMQVINTDEAILRLVKEVLSAECNKYTVNANRKPKLEDCVQHLFGFQYEQLSRHIESRSFPNSRKSMALRNCLEEMKNVTRTAGYPKV